MEPFEGLEQVLKPSLETAQFLRDLEAALEQEREEEEVRGE